MLPVYLCLLHKASACHVLRFAAAAPTEQLPYSRKGTIYALHWGTLWHLDSCMLWLSRTDQVIRHNPSLTCAALPENPPVPFDKALYCFSMLKTCT